MASAFICRVSRIAPALRRSAAGAESAACVACWPHLTRRQVTSGSDMRFTYSEAMTDPSFYVPLAQAAEDAGFTSFIVPDSVAYPEESDSTYPYTPDASREFLEGKAFFDPFVLTAALGAVTQTIR